MIIVTSLKGEYTEALKTAVPLADTRPGLTEFKKHVHSLLHFFLNRLWIVSHFIKTVLMIFFEHH